MTKQNEQVIEERPTESEEDDDRDVEAASPSRDDDATQFTNASGILGVNPYYGRSGHNGSALDGLGIKMTPFRSGNFSDTESDIATPMSAGTSYSDTGRAPIGITSMRKLLPSEQDDNRNSLSNFGMKRLEY
jgi:hypothetical protein